MPLRSSPGMLAINEPRSSRIRGLGVEFAKGFGRVGLDDRALEEIRIHPAVQLDWIDEDEVAEVLRRHQAMFDTLVRFDRGVAHVDQVVMAEIGAVDRVEAGAERIAFRVEGPRGYAIVAFTSKEEMRDEQIVDIAARSIRQCRHSSHSAGSRPPSPSSSESSSLPSSRPSVKRPP